MLLVCVVGWKCCGHLVVRGDTVGGKLAPLGTFFSSAMGGHEIFNEHVLHPFESGGSGRLISRDFGQRWVRERCKEARMNHRLVQQAVDAGIGWVGQAVCVTN